MFCAPRLGKWGEIQNGDSGHSLSQGWRRDRHVFKKPEEEYSTHAWGLNHFDIFALDSDGKNTWAEGMGNVGHHRKDPKTGDIDYTAERRLGQGPLWKGKRLYNLGYDEDHKDSPHMRPMKEA
jgi:hypothetical protein